MPITIIILLIILILLAKGSIIIVPEANEFIIETLGKYTKTCGPGLHFKIPVFQRVARRVSKKEHVADFEPCAVITKDNVTMHIDTVVFFKVFDSKLYTYKVENPIAAIEALCATTLRNIIGGMDLDSSLTSRDTINGEITATLDEATDVWGIKINRVEVKNIIPPQNIQAAMEKQMKAEREKRAVILEAEGKKASAITTAEGEKEAAILRADAIREERIRTAEGEAKALLLTQQAKADAIRIINEAAPGDAMLKLRSIEAMEVVANGQATKIIVPSDMQNFAATLATIKPTIDE
jgi:regulator of protease activity HflC (stomatin/prohibitin superfamily)